MLRASAPRHATTPAYSSPGVYGGFGMCWYWPLVISRSTQPTDALRIATITSRGPSVAGSGGGIASIAV